MMITALPASAAANVYWPKAEPPPTDSTYSPSDGLASTCCSSWPRTVIEIPVPVSIAALDRMDWEAKEKVSAVTLAVAFADIVIDPGVIDAMFGAAEPRAPTLS